MNSNVDDKLKDMKFMAEDAKDVRKMGRQETTDRKEGKVEYSRDKSSIKGVEGEEKKNTIRWKEDNVIFEPFNLSEEQEQGFFDESGNFVRSNRKGQEFDQWADDLEDHEVKLRKSEAKSTQEASEEVIQEDVLIRLIVSLLLPKENVAMALKRFAPKIQVKNKMKIRLPCSEFDQLTDAAYKLMEIGYINIYQDVRENLKVKEPEILWEYKMQMNSDEVFGPFSQEQMNYWKSEGFFNEEKPYIRRYGSKDPFQILK